MQIYLEPTDLPTVFLRSKNISKIVNFTGTKKDPYERNFGESCFMSNWVFMINSFKNIFYYKSISLSFGVQIRLDILDSDWLTIWSISVQFWFGLVREFL